MIIEETIKSLWRDLTPNGKLYLPFDKKDLQFKSHNIEFKRQFNSEEDKIDALIQGILTRVITKEPGKYVSAIAANNITQQDIDNFQNNKKINIEFEEITTEFPFKIMDQILTINITSPSNKDEKFKLAKSLILPYIKIKPGLPSIEEIKEADLAFDLFQKNNFDLDKIKVGFALNKEIKICKNNEWAYYSSALKLKYGIYYTPECFKEKSEQIIKKYHKESDLIWEPFAGDGRLVKNFKNKEISDILPIPGTKKNDYIKNNWTPKNYACIYTNPGFKVATKSFEKMLISGKPFGIYIPDYAVPIKALPVVEGFYTYSKDWPNLPINNSSKDGFGIVFLYVDQKAELKDSIILKDQNNNNVLLELNKPDEDLFDFGNSNFRRYHPQEYFLAYNYLFKGKWVDGKLGQFVRKSWIKDIDYIDGKSHWMTPPNGKSIQLSFSSQKELNDLLQNGWTFGRKQKVSKLRKK